MSASAILVVTALVVLFVFALALLAGSLALLAGARDGPRAHGGPAKALGLLDRQWPIERLVYRHHRPFGAVVLTASVFCLWQLTRPEQAAVLSGQSPASILLWVLLLAQCGNLAIGLIVFFRPSLLRPLERASNRWHELRVPAKGGPMSPCITAVLLALVALAVLLGSTALLLQRITPLFG